MTSSGKRSNASHELKRRNLVRNVLNERRRNKMKLGTFTNINWDSIALLVFIQLGVVLPVCICLIVLGVIG
jgi:hypothetical protein